MHTVKAAILLFCVLIPLTAAGAVIRVPTDQPTIQAGIDAASNGDTVLVADGTWSGSGNWGLDFGGRAITVRSENGPEACAIQSVSVSAPGLLFQNGEGPDSVVEGFTISGNNSYTGGGIRCVNSSPTIRNNIISGNRLIGGDGAGIYCSNSSPVIIGSIIAENVSSYDPFASSCGKGGGIYCSHSNPVIANNLIYGNVAETSWYYPDSSNGLGGGIYCSDSSPLIVNNLIRNNIAQADGGGIYCSTGGPVFRHNTISGNHAWDRGGGIASVSGPIFTDCIIWGNSPNSISSYSHLSTVTYCDVQGGYTGTGNIDADPLFVSGPDGEYCLSHLDAGNPADSPCINAGSELAANLCHAAGTQIICMNAKTTRTDRQPDSLTVDMGYHYDWDSIGAQLTCVPGSGTLPFSSQFQVTLTNQYNDQARRIQYIVDVTLAVGQSFSNWRRGWQNLQAGEVFTRQWLQNIPALQNLYGSNLFTLTAIDVTPAPYNLPPYPPSGDTDLDYCTIIGLEP